MKKKSNNVIHQFNPTIYPRKLWIVKNADEDFIRNNFKSINDKELEFSNECKAEVYQVYNTTTNKRGSLVVIYDDLEVGDIAHESFHVAMDMFDELGIYVIATNQEPLAYLIGFVADCINQVVTNNFRE